MHPWDSATLLITKLLELWIAEQESVNLVVQFGHKYMYAHLPQSTVDNLVLWLLDTRDCFDLEGRNFPWSLQQKLLSQPAQQSCISKWTAHLYVKTPVLYVVY